MFFFYPLWRILEVSLVSPPGGGAGLPGIIAEPVYPRVIWFTAWQAAASTVLTLAAGLPGAYVYARYRFFGKRLLYALTAVPFVLPSVVVASGFKALLGPRGVLNTWAMGAFHMEAPPIRIEHTIWFILLAHVFYNHAVVVRIVGGFWSRLPPSLTQAARTLGASPLKVFTGVTLPLLVPALAAASMLVFTFCFSSFGVILILGGPRFATIEVEIYRQAVHLFDLKTAGVLSLIQIGFALAFLGFYTGLMRRTAHQFSPHPHELSQRPPSSAKDYALLFGNGMVVLALLVAPMAALALQSVHGPDGLTLDYYRRLFENTTDGLFIVSPLKALVSSVSFASATLVVSLVLGLATAIHLSRDKGVFSRMLDPVLMLPLATSAVTLGLGFVVAFDEPPLNLRRSVILVPIAHTLVAYPFVVRSLLPSLRGIPSSLREAAYTLGASPARTFVSVILPIVSRALAVGAVFAFTMSIGEFGATLFVARPANPTMTLTVYRYLSQPGDLNYGCAMAMSTLLMAVTTAGFLFLERVRFTGEGEL